MSSPTTDIAPNFGIMSWVWSGLFVTIGLLGGLALWASITVIGGAVIAEGYVAVESKIKSVQHLEGGIVSEILVREGDLVRGGDLLLRLDGTDLRANLAITLNNLAELYAQRARLEAERDSLTSITFPPSLTSLGNADVVDKVIASQTLAYGARRANREGQIGVLNQKALQHEEEIAGLEAQKVARSKQLDLASADLTSLQPLIAQRLVPRQRVATLEREVAATEGDVGKVVSDLARTRAAIQETKLQILQIDKDFQEKVSRDLQDVLAKIPEYEEKRAALQVKLRLLEIRAPSSGRVLNMTAFTVGGVVTPAREIMQIVPESDQLVVESRISPSDINQVKIGQTSAVRISAFETRTTPMLNGRVVMVSGAQIVDPTTKATYFTVNVELPPSERARLQKDQDLKPGMPAEVYIATAERTVMDYLAKPLLDQIFKALRER